MDNSGVIWARPASAGRWLVVAGSLTAAAAHIPVIAPHLGEAPYMGVLFVVLTAACLAIAGATLLCDSILIYGLAEFTCGLAIIGYIATRLVAFPQLSDDVGNWLEPLGLASVTAEAVVIAAAIATLSSLPSTGVNKMTPAAKQHPEDNNDTRLARTSSPSCRTDERIPTPSPLYNRKDVQLWVLSTPP